MQIVYRSTELDGFAGAVADSIIYGRRDLGDQDRGAISSEIFTRLRVVLGYRRANVDFPRFVIPSLSRMHARSSARQL